MRTFDYHRPASLGEATGLLAAGLESRPLAGGMTLVPALKLRLSAPAALVDLGALAELRGLQESGGALHVGALTTHAAVASSPVVRSILPALADLAGGIGDPQVRNRGTLGGSIANNDPAADYPAALLALAATVRTSARSIPAEAFFLGMFQTALQPDEIVLGVSFPLPQAAAYEKFKSPASRYALVGVFVARTAAGVRVAVTGAGPGVFRAHAIEAVLAERFSTDALAGMRFPTDGLNNDLHGDAAYRANLIVVLARRAVARMVAAGAR